MTTAVLPLSFVAGSVCFGESTPGWTLLDTIAEDQDRKFAGRVVFDREFQSPPVVQLGITGFDIDNGANARLNVDIGRVDSQGFDIELRTWWNTRLWSVNLNWIAIGH
jgi:hypothetical protein